MNALIPLPSLNRVVDVLPLAKARTVPLSRVLGMSVAKLVAAKVSCISTAEINHSDHFPQCILVLQDT